MQNTIQLLPSNKRLKQLIQLHGSEWQVLEKRPFVYCFMGPGIRIRSTDNKHERWVRPEDISEAGRGINPTPA